MVAYVNYVKLSGNFEKIKKTESGSYFGRIIQVVIIDSIKVHHFLKFMHL